MAKVTCESFAETCFFCRYLYAQQRWDPHEEMIHIFNGDGVVNVYFVHVRTPFGAGTFEQSLREAGYTLVADGVDTTGISGCYIIHPAKKWYIRIELKSLPRDFLSVIDFTDLFL